MAGNTDLAGTIHGNPERPVRRGGAKAGLVLVVLGMVFLLQQTTGLMLRNWWALFILIPALSAFGTAYTLYRRSGRLTYAAAGSVFSGIIVLSVAFMFLLEADWAVYWPVFLLLPGLGMFFNGLDLTFAGRPQAAWLTWTGVSVSLLGVTFLAAGLGTFDPGMIMPHWWAVFILLPAAGGVIATARLYMQHGTMDAAVTANLAAALSVALVGLAALLGMDWNLVTPLILIGAGLVLMLGVLGSRRISA